MTVCISLHLHSSTCRHISLPSVSMPDRHPSFLSGPEALIHPLFPSLSPPTTTNICLSSNGEQNFLSGREAKWRQIYYSSFCLSLLSARTLLQFYGNLLLSQFLIERKEEEERCSLEDSYKGHRCIASVEECCKFSSV